MQVHDKVVCVYAGDCLNIETHGTYVITAIYKDDGHELNLDISTLQGKPCGSYNHRRFVLQENN